MPEDAIYSVSIAHDQQLIPLLEIAQHLSIELPPELATRDPENISDAEMTTIFRTSLTEDSYREEGSYHHISNLTLEQFRSIFQNYIPVISEYTTANNMALIENNIIDLVDDSDPEGHYERFIWNIEEGAASMGLFKNITIDLYNWLNRDGSIYSSMFDVNTLRQFIDADITSGSDGVYSVFSNINTAYALGTVDLPFTIASDVLTALGEYVVESCDV